MLLNDILVETLQERRTYTFKAAYLADLFEAAVSDPGDDGSLFLSVLPPAADVPFCHTDVKRDKFIFRVRLRGVSEEFIFLCDTEELRGDWLSSFARLIEKRK